MLETDGMMLTATVCEMWRSSMWSSDEGGLLLFLEACLIVQAQQKMPN